MDWSAVVVPLVTVGVVLVIVAGIVRGAVGGMRSERPVDAGESVASGVLGDLVDVFQPQRATLTQERERRRTDIAQRPAEGAPWDVDLDAGTVTLPPRGTR